MLKPFRRELTCVAMHADQAAPSMRTAALLLAVAGGAVLAAALLVHLAALAMA